MNFHTQEVICNQRTKKTQNYMNFMDFGPEIHEFPDFLQDFPPILWQNAQIEN